MSEELPQMKIRIPHELRDLISIAAEKNKRSMNAEICARLEQSLRSDALVGDADLNDPRVLMQGIDQFLTHVKQRLEQVVQAESAKADINHSAKQ